MAQNDTKKYYSCPLSIIFLKKKSLKIWCVAKTLVPLHSQTKTRAFSSVGLEHLPYKQRVGGSNPSTPTGVVPVVI